MKCLCAVLKVYGIKINDCEDDASDEFYVRALFCILECASGSVVEHRLPKARAAGSNPVSRLSLRSSLTVCQRVFLL